MVTRRELAAALEQELLVRGVRFKPGAAAAIVNDRIEAVADQMRVNRGQRCVTSASRA
jgi:hypothetical protein